MSINLKILTIKVRKGLFIFTGEFGYEILSFQGIIRKHRNKFDLLYVCSYKESQVFYLDFVDQFIETPANILNKIDKSDSVNTLPELELNEFILPFQKSGFQVYHRKNSYPNYPLDIQLDLTGQFGKYITLNTQKNTGQKIITFFPRHHNTHSHRSYSIEKFKVFFNLIRDKFIDYQFNIVVFENDYYGDKSEFNISGSNLIKNPTIIEQLNLQAISEFVVYNHSGSVFLNIMNSEKTPVFIYGISSDNDKYPNFNIFERREIYYNYVCKTDNVSDIEPNELFKKLIQFYDTIRK
jgi:hypothetical protein